MTIPIQLVFEAQILLDAVLERGKYYKYATQLLDKVANKEIEGWYSTQSIATLYRLSKRSLASASENRVEYEAKARKLIQSLLKILKPLPQTGDEFLEVISQPGGDYEKELIVHLAAKYLPNPLIVTRDKWFRQLSLISLSILKGSLKMNSQLVALKPRIDFCDLPPATALRPPIERNVHRVWPWTYLWSEVAQLEKAATMLASALH